MWPLSGRWRLSGNDQQGLAAPIWKYRSGIGDHRFTFFIDLLPNYTFCTNLTNIVHWVVAYRDVTQPDNVKFRKSWEKYAKAFDAGLTTVSGGVDGTCKRLNKEISGVRGTCHIALAPWEPQGITPPCDQPLDVLVIATFTFTGHGLAATLMPQGVPGSYKFQFLRILNLGLHPTNERRNTVSEWLGVNLESSYLNMHTVLQLFYTYGVQCMFWPFASWVGQFLWMPQY